jgi:hypothetical protein
MVYLDVDITKKEINDTKFFLYDNANNNSLFANLKNHFNAYNSMLSNRNGNSPADATRRLEYQSDISNIIGPNGIGKLIDIERTINSSSLFSDIDILKSQIYELQNKIVNKNYINNDERSNVLKNNFKDLYNKQYLMNTQLFCGIAILGIIITKSLFYEIKV